MIFLPIVERELRVAARRKGTYRIRLWTTVAALGVSFLFMVFAQATGGYFPNLGRTLFQILTYYTFGMTLLAGVLLAADCLSEEKREGTLGLLFLTDLKGYDVVSGKLIAVSLNALYGLMAVLPVTALPLLMGGVNVGEFWRMALALTNALVFALATGILVSAWSRDAIKAMGNTLALLVLTVAGLPILGQLLILTRLPIGWWYATLLSPYYPFGFSIGTAPEKYWISLLVSHAFAWLLLLVACWSLPRTWQDKPFRRRSRAMDTRSSRTTAENGILPIRVRLKETNPVAWLMAVDRTLRGWIWLLAGCGTVVVLATGLFEDLILPTTILGQSSARLFGFLLKVLLAIQACRFFVEARRSGALELLLGTPLSGREIVAGQWQGLKRLFLWPVVIFAAAQLFVFALRVRGLDFHGDGWPMELAIRFPYSILKLIADLMAVGWLGMWLGLSTKKPSLAPALTIFFGLILPGVAFCVPDLAIDVCIILWARGKLLNDFRRTAMPQYQPGVRANLA